MFALGYVHAQDRLWRMDFLRRLATGELSEFFGDETLPIDKYMRNIGLKRIAEQNYIHLDSDTKDILESYVAGINEYAINTKLLPIEYYILFVDYRPWTPVDTLSFHKFLSFVLSFDWPFELIRAYLNEAIGEELADEMLPHIEELLLYN